MNIDQNDPNGVFGLAKAIHHLYNTENKVERDTI